MKDIEQIYFNDFGVAFHWRKNDAVLKDRVQMIFKETGFYLSKDQIIEFADIIGQTCHENGCADCCHRARCHKFLLKTPLNAVDMAVSQSELLQIKDLVEGTLFKIDLLDYLDGVCKN